MAAYRVAALAHWTEQNERGIETSVEEGLTDRVLAALIVYDQGHPLWEEPEIVSAVQAFNVTHADWLLIVELFNKADMVFREQGRSFHAVYEAWRTSMRGGKS